MKVSQEEKQQIQERYLYYRNLQVPKEAALNKVAAEFDRGRTTVWDATADLETIKEDRPLNEKALNVDWPKTYILTGWDLRVSPDMKFIKCLEQLAEYYDAELVLVPCTRADVRYIPDEIKEKFYVAVEDIEFNANLQFKYVETSALVQSPLSGHVGAYPDYTTIIPGLIKELRTEPSQHYVKQLMSVGSVGYLNANITDYSNLDDKDFIKKWRTVTTRMYGKPTAVARNYVVPSALIVDVLDAKTFLTRYVSSHRSGVVYDLDKKFTVDGYENSQPSALVMGDTHAYNVDEQAYVATKEMITMFKPREVVLNDFFDGMSMNHHEINDAVKYSKAPSMREEADVTRGLLAELAEISNKIVYLQSNHDNFVPTVLNKSESLWRLNGNYETAVELQLYRVKEGKHPIIKLLGLDEFKNVKFVDERENYYIGKVLVKHGHEGINGARTGFFSLAKTYNYYVQGHEHAPKVFRNAVCVGLTGRLDMEYVVGANGMLHANSIIQPDSSVQLLPIIQGAWIK